MPALISASWVAMILVYSLAFLYPIAALACKIGYQQGDKAAPILASCFRAGYHGSLYTFTVVVAASIFLGFMFAISDGLPGFFGILFAGIVLGAALCLVNFPIAGVSAFFAYNFGARNRANRALALLQHPRQTTPPEGGHHERG